MCTNVYRPSYHQLLPSAPPSAQPPSLPPLSLSSSSSPSTLTTSTHLSRSKSTASTRPKSLITSSSSSSTNSTSSVFLQSALQCFYHHLTPDTLILPQSYCISPQTLNTSSSSSNNHHQQQLNNYHPFFPHSFHHHQQQHLQHYYHQLRCSIQNDNQSSSNNPLATAAALLLDRLTATSYVNNSTTSRNGKEFFYHQEDDLMTRSMPPSSAHLTFGVSDQPQGLNNNNRNNDCSKNTPFTRSVSVDGSATGAGGDRLALTNGSHHCCCCSPHNCQSQQQLTESTAYQRSNGNSSGRCNNCKHSSATAADASPLVKRGVSGSGGGSYVTELVAKFERRFTNSSSDASRSGSSLFSAASSQSSGKRSSVRLSSGDLPSSSGFCSNYKCSTSSNQDIKNTTREPNDQTLSSAKQSSSAMAPKQSKIPTASSRPVLYGGSSPSSSSSPLNSSTTTTTCCCCSHPCSGTTHLLGVDLRPLSNTLQRKIRSQSTGPSTVEKNCSKTTTTTTSASTATSLTASSSPSSEQKLLKKKSKTKPKLRSNCDILTTTAATANGFGCSQSAVPNNSSSHLQNHHLQNQLSPQKSSTSKRSSESSSANSTPSVSPTSPATEEEGAHSANNSNSNNVLSSSGSNSDNSSTDEGIDNSEEALLDEDDEDDQTIVSESLSHSHHEHHSNHHYQHHPPLHHRSRSRSRQTSGESRNSSRNTVPSSHTFTGEAVPTSEEAEEQVERFLNGTSAKNLADLETEAANLRREIADLEDPSSRKSTPTETNLDEDGDDDDEELREFQAIEREIKAAELRKCLATIEKRIEQCKEEIRAEEEEEKELQRLQQLHKHKITPKPANNLLARTFDQFATDSMTDSMIEECRQAADAAAQLKSYTAEEDEDDDVDDKENSFSNPRAPLAVADDEDWDSSESQISSAFSPTTTSTSKPSSLLATTTIAKLHLSADSENEEEEVEEQKDTKSKHLQKSPPVPPRKASLQPSEQSSTVGGAEAILFNCADFYRTSLHEDALHESIEASLQAVNGLSTADEEEAFLITSSSKPPPVPVKTESPPKSTSIIRRESQYENETTHECGVTHRRGYERIQASNRKLQQNGSAASSEEKCHSLDDLLNGKPTKEQEEEEMAYRRRSAKFPTEAEVAAAAVATNSSMNSSSASASSVTFRAKRNSESLNTVNGHHHQLEQSTSSLNSASHLRPLTLYLPSPNEELNLITHLHALGHDLTSSTVTHSLLITPFTCSGYLYKQCAGSSSKWRKRYFHFNRARKVFVYFTDRNAFEKRRHPKRGVFFDEVQDVYVDHTRMKSKSKLFGGNHSGHSSPSHLASVAVSSPVKGSSKHAHEHQQPNSSTRCVFVVATTTTNRKFILSTFSPELMRIWMDVIFTGANAYLQDYESYDA